MQLPVHDWQFWVATVIALVALRHVLRMLFPSGIPIGKRRRKAAGTRATLTVDRKPVDR
ncbi:MAG: hypothetical protein AMXMBFR58_09530 [Phycisphaerae bacterium]|nr:hypothetical protein [Phycisphaerales bacterium]